MGRDDELNKCNPKKVTFKMPRSSSSSSGWQQERDLRELMATFCMNEIIKKPIWKGYYQETEQQYMFDSFRMRACEMLQTCSDKITGSISACTFALLSSLLLNDKSADTLLQTISQIRSKVDLGREEIKNVFVEVFMRTVLLPWYYWDSQWLFLNHERKLRKVDYECLLQEDVWYKPLILKLVQKFRGEVVSRDLAPTRYFLEAGHDDRWPFKLNTDLFRRWMKLHKRTSNLNLKHWLRSLPTIDEEDNVETDSEQERDLSGDLDNTSNDSLSVVFSMEAPEEPILEDSTIPTNNK